MKKLFLPLILLVVVFACQMQDDTVTLSDDASANNSQTFDYCYNNTHSYNADGTELTLVIDGTAACAKDISHLVFKFSGQLTSRDCNAATGPMTSANVIGLSINGANAMGSLAGNLGNGDPCLDFVSGSVVKIENVPATPIVTIVMKFDVPVTDAFFLIKAGNSCVGSGKLNYNLSRTCTPPPTCFEEESAWAAGDRYVSRGNWATYTAYPAVAPPVYIYAGKNKQAGSVTMTPSGGNVIISITLNQGWSLQDVSNPVKIQGYTDKPASGNPSPGRFAHKGSSLTVTVPAAAYYGIHLDVRQAIACTN